MDSLPPKSGIDRTFWLDAALLFLLELALFLPALLRGEIPFFMDTIAQFYPIRHHAAQLLHDGQLPFWNRTMFCGVPLLANPQWGLLYPLNWPFLAWPGPFWFTVSYPLHFAIGGLGVYALVRKLTASRLAGWAGALAFLFSTMTLSRIAFGAHHLALAWVPWAWLLLHNVGWVSTHQFVKRTLLLTCIIALQLLSGAPQVAFYALLSYGILALAVVFLRTYESYRSHESHGSYRTCFQPLAILFLSALLGMMLAAPQLLPTWKFVQACDRGEGLSLEQVMAGTLDSAAWGHALFGGTGQAEDRSDAPEDPESTAYLGVWALVALIAILLRARKSLRFLLILAGLFIWAHPAVAPFLYRHAPLYASFHDPKRVLTIAAIALSVLSGVGLQKFFSAGGKGLKINNAISIIFIALAAASQASFGFTHLDLKFCRAGDFFDHRRAVQLPRDGRFFAFDTFARDTGGRGIYSYDYPSMTNRLFPNAAAFYGLEDVQGYDAFKLKPYAAMMRAVNRGSIILYESHFGLITNPASPMVARFATRYATGPADSHFALPGEASRKSDTSTAPFKAEAIEAGGEIWLKYKRFDPLVSFWPKAVIGDPFSAEADEANRTQLILNSGQNIPDFRWPESEEIGSIEQTKFEANTVEIQFTAPEGGGFILLRDAFAPGWSAKVDGTEAPVLLAEGMFRAVPVPAGSHTLTMRYWPPGLTAGLLLALLGVIVCAGFIYLIMNQPPRQSFAQTRP